jgi:GNAT superfamily N-acetyltransferase
MSWMDILKVQEKIIIDSRVYSEDYLFEHWNSDNPDDEFRRRLDRDDLPTISRIPAIYLVAIKGDRLVGWAGWIDKGAYVRLGGINVHPDFRRLGVFDKLVAARNNKIGDKPSVAAINTKTMNRDLFITKWEKYGYTRKDIKDIKGIPKVILGTLKEFYGDILVRNA